MMVKITERLSRSAAARAIRKDGGEPRTAEIDARVAASERRRIVSTPYAATAGWVIVAIDTARRPHAPDLCGLCGKEPLVCTCD